MQTRPEKPTLHLIDDDDEVVAQVTSYMTRMGIRGRRFPSLVAYLDWLDYERMDERTVIATAVELPGLSGVDLLDCSNE